MTGSCLTFAPWTRALDIVRWPRTTPIHELERDMRCKDCSEVRGYPHMRGVRRGAPSRGY